MFTFYVSNSSKAFGLNVFLIKAVLFFDNGKDLWECTSPLYKLFWFLTLFFKIQQKIFCQCYQNYHKGVYTNPDNSWGVFSDILAAASRLNTLYRLKTLYVRSSRYVRIIKKYFDTYPTFLICLWRHQCQIFTAFCSFYVIKYVESLDFLIEYVSW